MLPRRLGPYSRSTLTAVLGIALFPALAAAQRLNVPAAERASGAERVLVGHVLSVTPVWRDNDFGDHLIISIAHIAVDETLKGPSQSAVDVEIEGGTIGTLTLRVSDLEPFVPGDRAVFYLQHNRRGSLVPHRRGLGLQKLDRDGRVAGSAVTLDQVRRDVRAGGR